MLKEKVFGSMPPFMRLLTLLFFVFGGFLLSGIIIVVGSMLYTGGGVESLTLLQGDGADASGVIFMKIVQLINQFFVFILPSVFVAYLVSGNVFEYLSINRKPLLQAALLCIILIPVVLPFLGFLVNMNENMHFPSFLAGTEAWMRANEAQAMELTERFLNVDSYGAFMFNVFLIAIVPSFAEEFLFRGLMQRFLVEWTNRKHLAVIISALIFSAVHMQFFGFIPRFFLGLVLGYVFLWSGNLWYAVIIHFINNALTVSFYFVGQRYNIDFVSFETALTSNYPLIITSALLTVGLLWVLRKSVKKSFQ